VGCRDTQTDWELWVRDNGIGIAAKDFHRVFLVFQRLVSADAYEGTGIGLSVCKKIVEHHSGHIWIESELGQGSCFRFTLPKAECNFAGQHSGIGMTP
jgi:signal transduction histidine kinase